MGTKIDKIKLQILTRDLDGGNVWSPMWSKQKSIQGFYMSDCSDIEDIEENVAICLQVGNEFFTVRQDKYVVDFLTEKFVNQCIDG